MTTAIDIDTKLADLATVKEALATAEETLAALKDQQASIRLELTTMIKETGFDSVKAQTATVSLIIKPKFELTSAPMVCSWIAQNGLDLAFYTSLDTKKAKQLAEESYKQQGEIIDGFSVVETETLRITPRKEAMAA